MAVFMHIENESIPWDLGGCVWMWVVLVVCTVVKVLALYKLHYLVSAWYYTVGGLPTIAYGCVAPHSVSLSLVPPSLFLPSFSLSSPFLFPPLSFPLNTVDICPFY